MYRRATWYTTLVVALALLVAPATATVFDDTATPSWQTNSTGQVLAITSTPTAVYLGGNFTSVNDGLGGTPVAQARLAAFDPTTGDLIAGFAPDLNGTVRALASSPDGARLFAAGSFTTVNGQAISGLVELDPATGAIVAGIESGTSPGVYDLDLTADHLYVAGNITRVGAAVVSGAGRIDLATGEGDDTWTPTLSNGPARAIAAEPSLATVFIGGYFTSTNGSSEHAKLVAVDPVDASIRTDFAPGLGVEVFDLAATDDKLYLAVGGPGGRAEVRDPITGRLITSHVTDGDVQAVEVSDERVIFGHHGELLNGSFMPWVFAIDRASDAVDPAYAPSINAGQGYGLWAVHDAGSHLWLGGRILSAAPISGVGFLRYPASAQQPDDTVAPSTPAALAATAVADTHVALDWADSLDDSGSLYYRIERDGELVGTTSTSEFLDITVAPAASVSYQVVALDAAQNASASTPLIVTTLPPLTSIAPIAMDSTWQYWDLGGAAPAGWDLAGFDPAGWESGPAELGRNDGDEATVIDHPPAPSVTVFFRQEFDLPAGFTTAAAQLSYVRDDGLVVRVNGVEVLRDNLPEGPIDHTTRALVWQTANEATVYTTAIDTSAFVEGTNVISVELHNASSSGDLSFAASLDLGLVDDTTPPSVPQDLTVAGVTDTSVSLIWTPSTDDQGVTGYAVTRDGLVVGTSPVPSFTDTGLVPEKTYTYAVEALDAATNSSGLSSPVTATTDQGVPDVEAPTTPGSPTVLATSQDSISLTWTASTDNVGVVAYEIERDGVVVATVAGPSHQDLGLDAATSYGYAVRALDAAGNQSALSPITTASTDAAPPTAVEVMAFGSEWRFDDSGTYPGATWVLPAFDDAGWAAGPAHLGVGDGDETTTFTSQPTVWLRSTFDIGDPAAVVGASIEMVADDGAVVFVNGIEVVRDNVAPGTPDGSIAAIAYRYLAAEDQARTFTVPVGALAPGTNTIAVALVNAPGSGDMSFDLRMETLVGAGGGNDVTPPTTPSGVVGNPVTDATATITWSPSSDDTAVAGYTVMRDGLAVGTTLTESFVDTGLTAATSYTYEIEAFDPAGNVSARSVPLVITTQAAPPAESVLLPAGATWRYLDNGVYPGATWTDPAFDDATWATGAAPFAANDPGTTTIANRPATWFRTTVDVSDVNEVVALELDVMADDSAVVFINGVEVARDNIGPGPVDGTMPATTYRWGSAETEFRTYAIPHAALIEGENTISVALVNGAGSGDGRLDVAIRQFRQP